LLRTGNSPLSAPELASGTIRAQSRKADEFARNAHSLLASTQKARPKAISLWVRWSNTTGWRLSPAYDLNPVPTDVKPRILSTAINEDDNTASLALALDVAGYFELDAAQTREIAAQVGKAVSKWRDESARQGLSKAEIDRMASAFEHEDSKLAGA